MYVCTCVCVSQMQKHYKKKVHTLKEELELSCAEKEQVTSKREAMV